MAAGTSCNRSSWQSICAGWAPARSATATALRLLAELAGFTREVPGIGSFPLTMHIGVEADFKNPGINIAQIYQGGLGLPDRDYYLKDDKAPLREKYADDRQKQSEEMMALYRREGVNPLGGCLPMVLQLPVFIGLFYALLIVCAIRGLSLHLLALWRRLRVPDRRVLAGSGPGW